MGLRRPFYLKFFKKIVTLAFLPLAIFLLSGCEKGDWNQGIKEFDNKIGDVFDGFQVNQQDEILNMFNKKTISEKATSTDLTEKQKEKIDNWLDEKNYNRYGDSKNAVYVGGTPLFDEKTGKAIDRYDYILSKYPNLLEELENKK